jgi:WD40 repeat protein
MTSESLRLWDLASGEELRPEGWRLSKLYRLALSPSGNLLIACREKGPAELWDVSTGDKRDLIPLPEGWNWPTLVFSPNGKILALAKWKQVLLWDLERRQRFRTLEGPCYFIDGVAFSPDGSTLTAKDNGPQPDRHWSLPGQATALVWNVKSGELIHSHTIAHQAGGDESTRIALALSADGRTLAAYKEGEGPSRFWSLPDRLPMGRLQGGRGFCPELFAPDGKTLVGWNTKGETLLWETATGGKIRTLPGCYDVLGFSPDGRLLGIADNSGAVSIHDLLTDQVILRTTTFSRHFAFGPDSRHFAAALEDGTVLLWDLTSRVAPQTLRSWSVRDLNGLWSDLSGRDAARADRAIWKLASSPHQTVPLIRERLAVPADTSWKRLERLLADLDDDAYAVRERASRELSRLGDAWPELARLRVRSASAEVRHRAEALLDAREFPGWSAETVLGLRAVRVLELIDSAEARALLAHLARGRESLPLTQDARAALLRLECRTRR